MIQNVLFDFDGVIIDSNQVKEEGFRYIFRNAPSEKVAEFIDYHNKHQGISRYQKIRKFHEEILNTELSVRDERIFLDEYSKYTIGNLEDPSLLIDDVISFIKKGEYHFHIVSGTDCNDLRYICKSLKIDTLFRSIEGSPKTKPIIIDEIIAEYHYDREETAMIGDSIDDYHAAMATGIVFYGYNNPDLRSYGYIDSFAHAEL